MNRRHLFAWLAAAPFAVAAALKKAPEALKKAPDPNRFGVSGVNLLGSGSRTFEEDLWEARRTWDRECCFWVVLEGTIVGTWHPDQPASPDIAKETTDV